MLNSKANAEIGPFPEIVFKLGLSSSLELLECFFGAKFLCRRENLRSLNRTRFEFSKLAANPNPWLLLSVELKIHCAQSNGSFEKTLDVEDHMKLVSEVT